MRDKNRIPEFITYFVKGSDYLLSEEQYKKYYMCEPIHKSNLENTYYKVCCYYNAKTELFDRELSSLRGRYDDTSAFITNGEDKRKSNKYAHNLFQFCKEILIEDTHHPFDYRLWETIVTFDEYEYWFITYEKIKSNGELDFIEKYIFDEKEI